jgi:hypothetical protein
VKKMRWFKKKRKLPPKEEEVIRSPCEIFGHTWKDFPPYLEYSYKYGEECHIKIVESYVCICCKKRIDEVIGQRTVISFSQDKFFREVNQVRSKYKELLKPRPVVEDMIHDAIYVDREKLEAWDRLHGKVPEKKEFKLKVPGEDE